MSQKKVISITEGNADLVELHTDNMTTLAFLRKGRTKANWTLKQHFKLHEKLMKVDMIKILLEITECRKSCMRVDYQLFRRAPYRQHDHAGLFAEGTYQSKLDTEATFQALRQADEG